MPNASPRRKLVSLGVVGCAAAWEDSCRELIRRPTKPVVLSGIYHPVPALAEQLARDWQCSVAPSLTRLFERRDIDAVVVLDTGWQGWYALELAVRFRKPALVTGPWLGDLSGLESIHLAARDAGVLLMAAFPRRHSPAANRLRELMATKLGPAAAASVESVPMYADAPHDLIEWIDWCSSVLGRAPVESQRRSGGESSAIDLRFAVSDLRAEVLLRPGDAPASEQLRVKCRHGEARILGERDIEWTIAGQTTRETLPSERSGTEIILDQFCRRVVGGLVPVADLGDLLCSVRLAEQCSGDPRGGSPKR